MPDLLEYNSAPAPFRWWPFLSLAIIAWAFAALAVISFPLQHWAPAATHVRFEISLDQWWPYLALLSIILVVLDFIRWEFTSRHGPNKAPLYARILRASLLTSAFVVSVFMPFHGYA